VCSSDLLVDVFGGSGAVTMNAGFQKRIYNDADGDMVNLFRVLSDGSMRMALLKMLRWQPPSRRIFEEDYNRYLRSGFSFGNVSDPIERARATFYRQHFAYGGKARSGGFVTSTGDRGKLKEAYRYARVLRKLAEHGRFWRETVLENQHYADCISIYGQRPNVVLFCDPPYVGTENLYSHRFGKADHIFLAEQLATCRAPAVVTYYDEPIIRQLYHQGTWAWHPIESTKNMQRFVGARRVDSHWKGQVAKVTEWVLTRKANDK
jgi:DNA adenine methylase